MHTHINFGMAMERDIHRLIILYAIMVAGYENTNTNSNSHCQEFFAWCGRLQLPDTLIPQLFEELDTRKVQLRVATGGLQTRASASHLQLPGGQIGTLAF